MTFHGNDYDSDYEKNVLDSPIEDDKVDKVRVQMNEIIRLNNLERASRPT
jgi:hypothetical protein